MHTHLSVSYAGFARAFDTRALCYRALLVDFNNKCTHICLIYKCTHIILSVSYAGFARAFNTQALCSSWSTHFSVSYTAFARALDTRALCYRALLVDFNNKCTHICLCVTLAFVRAFNT